MHFDLDEESLSGLELYFEMAAAAGLIPRAKPLEFASPAAQRAAAPDAAFLAGTFRWTWFAFSSDFGDYADVRYSPESYDGRAVRSEGLSQHLLFSGVSVFDVIENQKLRLRDELQHMSAPNLDDENLPQRLADGYGMRVPVLDDHLKYAKSKETQIDVSHDPMRFISDRSRPFHMPGTELSIFVPFTGDPGIFNVRPSSFDVNPPRADVVSNELCFVYRFVEAPTNLTSEYERTIAQVKKYLDWLRPSAVQLQKELEQLAQTLVAQRRTQAAAHARALDSLGIPIRRDDVPRAASATPRSTAHVKTGERDRERKGKPVGWDVFICHASEDKEEIARPLANALDGKGLSVWYDEFSLRIGDSLRQSIDQGLLRSKFGVVILSPYFFEKHWPQQELNGLATRELGGRKVILPVWHNISFEEVRRWSPILADRLAVSANEGLDKVVDKIMEAMW